MSALDYVIIIDPDPSGEFQVWTPDETGAILGIGATEREAIQNAVQTMEATIKEMMATGLGEFIERRNG